MISGIKLAKHFGKIEYIRGNKRGWDAFAVCNSNSFYSGMDPDTHEVVVDYIDWHGKRYFISSRARIDIPSISDVTFAFILKMGFWVELDKEFVKVVDDLIKNPDKYGRKYIAYKRKNPDTGYDPLGIIEYLMNN